MLVINGTSRRRLDEWIRSALIFIQTLQKISQVYNSTKYNVIGLALVKDAVLPFVKNLHKGEIPTIIKIPNDFPLLVLGAIPQNTTNVYSTLDFTKIQKMILNKKMQEHKKRLHKKQQEGHQKTQTVRRTQTPTAYTQLYIINIPFSAKLMSKKQ
jgi:hypothetical protein